MTSPAVDYNFEDMDQWANDAVVGPLRYALARATPDTASAASLDIFRPAIIFFIRFQMGESIESISKETGIPAERIEYRIRAVFHLCFQGVSAKAA